MGAPLETNPETAASATGRIVVRRRRETITKKPTAGAQAIAARIEDMTADRTARSTMTTDPPTIRIVLRRPAETSLSASTSPLASPITLPTTTAARIVDEARAETVAVVGGRGSLDGSHRRTRRSEL